MKRGILLGLFSFFSMAASGQWVAPSNTGLGSLGNNPSIVASTTHLFVDGTYRSADLGETWELIPYALELNKPSTMYWFDGRLFSGHNSSGETIFYSDDSGSTWNNTEGGPRLGQVYTFHSSNGLLFAGTGGSVYKSSDRGLTWASKGTNMGAVISITSSGGVLFATSTAANGVWVSTDDGETWEKSSNQFTTNFDRHGDFVYAFGERVYYLSQTTNLFVTTDNGASWSRAGYPASSQQPKGAYFNQGRGYLRTQFSNDRIYLTYDGGRTWTNFTDNLPNTSGQVSEHLVEFSGNLWTTSGDTVYRRDISSLPTHVEAVEVPSRLTLTQNYPNPFFSKTSIPFSIDGGAGHSVTLEVYDVLGQLITTLVDGPLSPGQHSVTFDTNGLAPGIYISVLSDSHSRHTNRMILLK